MINIKFSASSLIKIFNYYQFNTLNILSFKPILELDQSPLKKTSLFFFKKKEKQQQNRNRLVKISIQLILINLILTNQTSLYLLEIYYLFITILMTYLYLLRFSK